MATITDAAKKKLAKDKELQSQKHDEILNWLYRNAAGLIGGIGNHTYHSTHIDEITEEAHSSLYSVVNQLKEGLKDFGKKKRTNRNPCVPQNDQEVKWLKKQTAFYEQFLDDISKFKELLVPVPNFPGVIVDQAKLQSPIYDRSMKRNNYLNQDNKIIGFMDMEAEIYSPSLSIGGINEGFRKDTAKWIAPEIKFHTHFDSDSTTWYFDVRTSVENLGVLLREIEVLRNALEISGTFSGVYAVVAPQTESSFKIFENHDIKPIDYDPEIEFDPKDFIPDTKLKRRFHEMDFESDYETPPLETFQSYTINEFD